jgi:cytochrome c oxidase subunit 1
MQLATKQGRGWVSTAVIATATIALLLGVNEAFAADLSGSNEALGRITGRGAALIGLLIASVLVVPAIGLVDALNLAKTSKGLDEPGYLSATGSWLASLDHKRIGVSYLIAVVFAWIIAAALQIMLGIERMTPGVGPLTPDRFLEAMDGEALLFTSLVVLPAIPAALGNFLLPLQVGANNMVWPRLNRLGLVLHLIGTLTLTAGVLLGINTNGAVSMPDIASYVSTGGGVAFNGVVLVTLGALCTGLNFVGTVHLERRDNLRLSELPLFTWSLYLTGWVQVFAGIGLLVAVKLFILDYDFDIEIFGASVTLGTSDFITNLRRAIHPAALVALVPAAGILTEIFNVHAKEKVYGDDEMRKALIALAVLGYLAWGVQMSLGGASIRTQAMFSFLGMLTLVPIAVLLFGWLMMLRRSRASLNGPLAFAIASVLCLAMGALGTMFLSALATGAYLQDTTFASAVLGYYTHGAVLLAFFGGLWHWWPKITGRTADSHLGVRAAGILFVSVNVACLPQVLGGFHGMPRSSAVFDAAMADYNLIAFLGVIGFVTGVLVAFQGLAESLRSSTSAAANPYEADSLEWTVSSPPKSQNFA